MADPARRPDLAGRPDLDALAARLDRDGYVVIPGLFDDADLDVLRAAALAVEEAAREGSLDRRSPGD